MGSVACVTDMQDFLCALPKCEHHIHIEGSLSPTLLFQLSEKNGIPLPKDDEAFKSIDSLERRYTEFANLQDFLDYYYLAMSTLLEASDFEDLMYAYLARTVGEGLMHAEIFFDPQAHTDRGVSLETVVAGLKAGICRAEAEFDVSANLIMCFLRHLPAPHAQTTFERARELALFSSPTSQASILGVGLDSAELPFPPELFREVYAAASTAGLRLTAHAGEEGPASYIAAALDHLQVHRIDHGIQLATDPALMQKVASSETLLTICPLSNVRLRAVESVRDLPIREFIRANVKFSINSDDPAYFGGYILDNFLAVQEAHELTKREWIAICTNAIQASWCQQQRKDVMLQRLRQVERQFDCLA